MKNQIVLPKASWIELVGGLIHIKLDRAHTLSGDDVQFLQQLKYLDQNIALTELGSDICLLEYVKRDAESADMIHHEAMLSLPVTQAILQSLWGLEDINVEQVNNALTFLGVDELIVSKRLTNMLQILNRHKILIYGRKNRSVKLLEPPIKKERTQAPDHIYIDRTRPFSNDFYIREIIREANGTLMWLDKYFQKEAFEWLWREADAAKINAIKIVSSLGDEPVDAISVSDYKKLQKELSIKGISLEWRTLVRGESHDFHDRWILDDNGLCYNLPSIHSIKSGQRSELHKSPNGEKIQSIFDGYFESAKPVA